MVEVVVRVSRLLQIFPPGALGRQAALHYALLPPSLRTPATIITHTCLPLSRASAILDSLNHLFSTTPIFVSSPALLPVC